jgi:hypothetical protein
LKRIRNRFERLKRFERIEPGSNIDQQQFGETRIAHYASSHKSFLSKRDSSNVMSSIGILNHLFFWPEQYRRTGGMSIVFLFDENPDVASAGSGGAAVGGARSVPDHAARSNSERAAPSACVGNRFSAPQIVRNKSNRCAGARWGAGRQAQMGEDLDDYRRIFDGSPSTRLRTGDDLQAADGGPLWR